MSDTKKFEITERPIDGSKYREEIAVEQVSAAEFIAALDAVLDIKGVKAIRWRQYTPYFNDGDPCEFSINDFTVKLGKKFYTDEEEEESGGDYEDGYLDSYELYSHALPYPSRPEGVRAPGAPYWQSVPLTPEQEAQYKKDREAYNASQSFTLNGQPTEDISEALKKLNSLSGTFEAVAKANFGDHATITATKAGFEVEEYEHD